MDAFSFSQYALFERHCYFFLHYNTRKKLSIWEQQLQRLATQPARDSRQERIEYTQKYFNQTAQQIEYTYALRLSQLQKHLQNKEIFRQVSSQSQALAVAPLLAMQHKSFTLHALHAWLDISHHSQHFFSPLDKQYIDPFHTICLNLFKSQKELHHLLKLTPQSFI